MLINWETFIYLKKSEWIEMYLFIVTNFVYQKEIIDWLKDDEA